MDIYTNIYVYQKCRYICHTHLYKTTDTRMLVLFIKPQSNHIMPTSYPRKCTSNMDIYKQKYVYISNMYICHTHLYKTTDTRMLVLFIKPQSKHIISWRRPAHQIWPYHLFILRFVIFIWVTQLIFRRCLKQPHQHIKCGPIRACIGS